METFNPPVEPSPGTSTKPTFKLLEAEFGDGYTQVTRDGMNHTRRVVTLKWDVLTEAQAGAIEAFLVGQGGDTAFLYALRGDVIRQWRCTEHERKRGSPNTLSATFTEDFGIH